MYEFKNVAQPPRPPAARQGGCGVLGRDIRLFLLDDDPLDAWQERMAMCTVDGGLSDEEAKAVAWRQMDAALAAHVGAGAASVAGSEARPKGDALGDVGQRGASGWPVNRYFQGDGLGGGHAEQSDGSFLFVSSVNILP